jgi:hypothetical protein
MFQASRQQLAAHQFKPQELAQYLWCFGVVVESQLTKYSSSYKLTSQSNEGGYQFAGASNASTLANTMSLYYAVFDTVQQAIISNIRRTSPSTLNEVLSNFVDFLKKVRHHVYVLSEQAQKEHGAQLDAQHQQVTVTCNHMFTAMNRFLERVYVELQRPLNDKYIQHEPGVTAMLAKGHKTKLETYREKAQKDLISIMHTCKAIGLYTPPITLFPNTKQEKPTSTSSSSSSKEKESQSQQA